MRKIWLTILIFVIIFLPSCSGLKFKNQKVADATEFSKGEAMIFVTLEKNKYEKKFGNNIWRLRSGDGKILFKDYVVNNVKMFVEKMMKLKLIANDINVAIGTKDLEILENVSNEYYENLTSFDIEYMEVSYEDVINAYNDYHLSRLVVDRLSRNATEELSISEAKVIRVEYIVFDDRNLANETYEKLKAKGANFSYFAKTRSKDSEIEMIVKRGDEISTKFPEIFYLSNGKVSDILSSGNRYYIFRCVDDYLVEETEERRIEILKSLKISEFNKEFKEYDEKYLIKSNSAYWNNIDLSDGINSNVSNFEEIYYRYFPKDIK